jgi:hypothetical protein
MVDNVAGLYEEIMQRDYRAFYLAWLGAIQDGTEYSNAFSEETLEPPVPPGLDALSPCLEEFVELFEIDEELIGAAAQSSRQTPPAAPVDPVTALSALSKEECVDFLQRFLLGEAHLDVKLKQRIGLLPPDVGYAPTGQRTVGELLAARDQIAAARQQAAAAAKEAKRRAQMAALATRGEAAWQEVDAFILQKTNDGYKLAVALLLELRELAREQKQERTFASRVAEIRSRYSRRSGLLRELNQAHL